MPIPIRIFIDISGSPRENIFIGAVSFNSYQASQFEDSFLKKFPFHKKRRWKSSNIDKNKLIKILHFLSDNRIYMACTKITSQNWRIYKKEYGERGYLNAKIMGIYYFNLLRAITLPKSVKPPKYDVIFCKESSIDINKAINVCLKLAKSYNRNFGVKTALAKHETLLKFPDYVAGSFRKVSTDELLKVKRLRIVKKKAEPFSLSKVFRR